MRLSVLFLLVLALAAIGTSMAAWGIMYGTAYGRVSSMTSVFTSLAQDSFGRFGSFVSDLLQGNAALVDAILAAQRRSGENRTEETKGQMARTVAVLVNFSVNLTDQTQIQTWNVLNVYGTTVNDVADTFQLMARLLAQEIRRDVLAQGVLSVNAVAATTAATLHRFGRLVSVGTLDLSRSSTAAVSVDECALLDDICGVADTLAPFSFAVTSPTGRVYNCSTLDGATVSYTQASGGTYSEYRLRWPPYNASVPDAARQPTKQRCAAEAPAVEVVGLNCSIPQCGTDPQNAAWYRAAVSCPTCGCTSTVQGNPSGGPRLHVTLPLLNASAALSGPPAVVGVADASASLADAAAALSPDPWSLFGIFGQPLIALLLNDSNLTVLATNTRQCDANEVAPGDPQMPLSSGYRSCDAGLQAVVSLVAASGNPYAGLTLDRPDVLWNISPLQQTAVLSYYFVVGLGKAAVESFVSVSQDVQGVMADLLKQLQVQAAQSAAATHAYAAALGTQNLEATQAMQDGFLTELAALEAASRTSLAASQHRSAAQAGAITAAQTTAAEVKKVDALEAMSVAAGWTVGVVCAILLAVLGLSAWGTTHVAGSLNHIIDLMEDVADLKVENLTVPQGSRLHEVTRIQSAFQVMVLRLAEYKSYIPAGVFEKANSEAEEAKGSDDEDTTDWDKQPVHCGPSILAATNGLPGRRHSFSSWSHASSHGATTSPHDRPAQPVPGRRSAMRPVAVLVVNLVGVLDTLLARNDALSKTLFNEYVTLLHEVASLGCGNVDFLAGDQAVVTFNAHVPCSDPPGAAAAVATDLRQQVLRKFGDRLRFHIVITFGPVFANTVGYSKFKFMATVGTPLKVATVLAARLEHLPAGAIVADAHLQARAKYSYEFRPMETAYLPWLKYFTQDLPTSHRLFLLTKEKALREDEWLYQVGHGGESTEWDTTFKALEVAASGLEAESCLKQYLAAHPLDEVALRLQDRLALWTPGLGIPM